MFFFNKALKTMKLFFQGTYYGTSIAVRISGNLNMANATSLANRIEAVLTEEFHDHSWTDDKVV
jgi:hypothetical protein